MPRQSTILNNFLWVLSGNATYFGAQWLIIVIIARLLDAHAVGIYSLALAIITPIFFLADLQLNTSLATDAAKSIPFGSYFKLRTITTPLALAVIGAIAFLGQFEPTTRNVLFIVAVGRSVESYCLLYHGLSEQHQRMRPLGLSLIFRGAGAAIMFTIVLAATSQLAIAVIGLVISNLTVLLLFDIPATRPLILNTTKMTSPISPYALAKTVLPLGLATYFSSLAVSIPVYFIAYAHGKEVLGQYASNMQIIMIALLGVAAIGQSANPLMATKYHNRDIAGFLQILRNKILFVVGICAILLCAITAIGPELIELVYGADFRIERSDMALLCAGGSIGFIALLLAYATVATRRFRAYFVAYALVSLVSLTAAYFFIPQFDIRGAAFTLIILHSAAIAMLFIVIKRALQSIRIKPYSHQRSEM